MRMSLRTALFLLPLPAACLTPAGCVQRTLQIESSPPGALVYLNGDEAGRTPMRKNFVWYGTYDVELRKDGYRTLNVQQKVWAPWWQWPPFDFFAEALPLEDKHYARYRMEPVTELQTDPQQVLVRAVETQAQLKGKGTRQPADGKRKPAATQPRGGE